MPERGNPGAYLAVCAIFRDEAPYLAEWIEFHRLVGVEHFCLFDNRSTDLSREVLKPWVLNGLVTVVDWPTPFSSSAQRLAYQRGLAWGRDRVRWLAFIDIDEFLFSPQNRTLAGVLREYEQHPGVVVNWQVYGSSGFEEPTHGLVIESFVQRASTQWIRNQRVKSIVDPDRALSPHGPHFFSYVGGALAVNENHESVQVITIARWRRAIRRALARLGLTSVDPFAIRRTSSTRVSVQRLRINHYAVKSRQEFASKRRRHANEEEGSRSRLAPIYRSYHDRNEVHDPVLAQHAAATSTRLAARFGPAEPS